MCVNPVYFPLLILTQSLLYFLSFYLRVCFFFDVLLHNKPVLEEDFLCVAHLSCLNVHSYLKRRKIAFKGKECIKEAGSHSSFVYTAV